jgi:hypothetical protein
MSLLKRVVESKRGTDVLSAEQQQREITVGTGSA